MQCKIPDKVVMRNFKLNDLKTSRSSIGSLQKKFLWAGFQKTIENDQAAQLNDPAVNTFENSRHMIVPIGGELIQN